MGKIADALERHDKEKVVKLDDVKEEKPRRLVVEEAEVKFARQIASDLISDKSFSDSIVMLSAPDSADAETFKVLRGQILFPKDRKVPRSMLVTSTFPAEGKTYVASNLATALAMSIDDYVLAIDADLRRPRLHNMFGYSKVKGLHDYLVGNAPLDELIIKTGIDKLSVLPAGKPPRNPTELVSSNMMVKFLEEVKELNQDRFIIIDSPPSSVTAESKFLAQQVDGIIFVVMANKTPRKDIEKAIDNLGREKILGIVFNGYEQVRKSYHRYYDRYYKGK
jgi:exopolysaccharide/PEP-CTERM locus tyrosine autokinase